MKYRFLTGAAAVALAIGFAAAGPALADDQPPPHPTVNTPVGPIMFSGSVEAGVNGNVDDPANHTNFGQLFTERANTFRMNQAEATAEKDLDPNATGLDWGFKFEPMYGTDARITHTFGLWDRATNSPYQFDIVEANLQAHVPVVVPGGVDLKAGIYSTPIGYEVINATGNFFYTHSYIFNYGIPLKHFGIISTAHATSLLDVWFGVDTGNQAFIPNRWGDNNAAAAILGGFGINNPIPNLTILALTHLGPGQGYNKSSSTNFINGAGRAQDVNGHSQQIYDIVTTYKVNDNLSVANEIDYIKDDLGVTNCTNRLLCHSGATAEGTALYGIYTLNDQLSFGARGEVFRDDQGFFVATETAGQGFVDSERAITGPGSGVYSVGKATYSELTLGVNYKPPLPAMPLNAGLTLRPEFRWDHAWGMAPGSHAFDTNSSGVATKDDQILLSLDAILAF